MPCINKASQKLFWPRTFRRLCSDLGNNLSDLIKAILAETDIPRLSSVPWNRGNYRKISLRCSRILRLMPHLAFCRYKVAQTPFYAEWHGAVKRKNLAPLLANCGHKSPTLILLPILLSAFRRKPRKNGKTVLTYQTNRFWPYPYFFTYSSGRHKSRHLAESGLQRD